MSNESEMIERLGKAICSSIELAALENGISGILNGEYHGEAALNEILKTHDLVEKVK